MCPSLLVTWLLLFLVVFLATIQQGTCHQLCKFHDDFNRIKYINCPVACCGSYHRAYCCLNRHTGEIAAGSIGGFVLLVCLICVTVCCYRKIQQKRERTRLRTEEGVTSYGSINTPGSSGQQEGQSNLAVAIRRQNPNVWLTVTPPTPTQLDQGEICNQPFPAPETNIVTRDYP